MKQKLLTLLTLSLLAIGQVWGATYTKVTSVTTGRNYLVVYYSGSKYYVFDGSNPSNGGSSANITFSPTNDVVTGDFTSYTITITASHTTGKYFVQSANGNYIGRSANSNGMDLTTTKPTSGTNYDNTITYNSATNAQYFVIAGSGGRALGSNSGPWKYYSSTNAYTHLDLYEESTGSSKTTVNVSTFEAEATTLVVNGTTNTSVTNDQSGWTPSYIYTSSDETVATVSNTGVITAKKKGTADITCTPNISGDNATYAKGASKTITITVNNPNVTAHFFVDGVEDDGKKIVVEGGSALGALPTATSTDPEYTEFIGWTEAAEITAATTTCPALISATTTISADKTYRAVFAKATTTTFDASDITNTPAVTGEDLSWADATTGVKLHLSAGSRYTSAEPYTFSITNGTNNYFQVIATNGIITKIATEVTNSDYKVNSTVTGAVLTGSGTSYTITSTSLKDIKAYATSSKQIRAKTIVVTNCSSFLTKFSNDPQISVSESSLSGFEAIATAGAGAAKSFKVSGVKLQGNISVTVSGNYEICQTVDGSYSNSLTLTRGGDNKVAETTIYVRLKAHDEAVATENGSISITSTNADTKSVTLAGTVAEKVLNSIAIKTAPTKTTYILGEIFEPAGLVITRAYNSGEEDLTYVGHEEEFTFSPDLETAITGSTANVQITWGTKTVNQSISKQCSVAWSVNGTELTSAATTVGYNTKVTALPTAPTSADCDESKVFVGWTATAIDGETDSKPTDLFTEASGAQNLTANTTYYAVFANASEGGEPTTVLSEDFSSITDGNSANTNGSSTSWTKNANFGNVSNAYKAGGALRIGKNASLTTKQVDLSAGEVTVSVDVKGWSSSETKLSVQVDNQATQNFSTTGYIGGNNTDFVNHVFTFSKGTTSSVVKFTTDANTRVFIDNIVVKCGDGVEYSAYATTCCTKWDALTLTYSYTDAIHVNDHVDATWGEGTTHGTVRFESSNEEVLTVADNGQITAVGAGRATITAYWEGTEGYCNNSVTSNEVVVTNSFNIIYKDKGDAAFSGAGWEAAQPTTHTYGTATTLVEPTKNYYTFSGWFIASDCSGEALTELAADGYTEDITLYAKWTAKEYAITYNNVEGATHSNPEKFTVESATIELADASKTGHTFGGWYDAETDGNKVTSIAAGSHEAVVLYAKWTINNYDLVWSLGGGQVSASSPVYTEAGLIAYNTAITAPVVEREGYRFAGWKCNDADVDFGAEVLMPAAAATYVAQWIKVWTVDFQNNGESITGYPKTVDENAALGALPTGEGLEACHATSTTFMGWSTADIIVPGDKPADNTFATAETTVIGDLVYNAVWAKKGGAAYAYKYVDVTELTKGLTYVFVSANEGESAYAIHASNLSTATSTQGTTAPAKIVTLTTSGADVVISTADEELEFTIDNKGNYNVVSSNEETSLRINGNGIFQAAGAAKWDEQGLYGTNNAGTKKYYVYAKTSVNPVVFDKGENASSRVYAFEKQQESYSEYITKCSDEVIYDINLDENVTNGTIEADKYKALVGDKITLNAMGTSGYEFSAWDVYYMEDETKHSVTVTDDQFTMPAANVIVNATFVAKAVTSITLSQTSITADLHETAPTISVTGYSPTDLIEANKGVTWSVSPTSVATINEETGVISLVGTGSAIIKATSKSLNTITATCALNVYQWNQASTAYVVTPGTLDNLTDAMTFTASEWGVKANYVRSDNEELTKQETVADWKAFIGETEIANGYQYQLTDNNKTLYIKVGEVVAGEYTLGISAVDKDHFVVNIFDVDGIDEYYTGNYTAPAIADQTAGTVESCQDHNIFVGWVLDEYKDNPTDEHIVKVGDPVTANNDTYYAVWGKNVSWTGEKTMHYGWEDGDSKTGWNICNLSATQNASAHDGSKIISSASSFNSVICTNSAIAHPKSMSVWVRRTTNNTNNTTFAIQVGDNTSSWNTTVKSVSISSTSKDTWYEVKADLSSYSDKYVNFAMLNNAASRDIDDVTLTYEVTEDHVSDYITACVTRYDLSFDVNGGKGESFDDIAVAENGSITLPTPTTLTKDRCTLTGWYAIGENDEPVHYGLGDSFTMPSKATTLYAEWTPWTLESIALTLTKDVKTAYDETEMFSTENLVVKATYTDHGVVTLDATEWTTNLDEYKTKIFGHEFTGAKTVIVSFGGKTANYDITIQQFANVYFKVNNQAYTNIASKDGKMVFPAVPTSADDELFPMFVGWTKTATTETTTQPTLAQLGDDVEDNDVFYAVFGSVTGYEDATVTINRSKFENDLTVYSWYQWTDGDITGQGVMYGTTKASLQTNQQTFDKVIYNSPFYNEVMLPGNIKEVRMLKNSSGTDRAWKPYFANTAFTKAMAASDADLKDVATRDAAVVTTETPTTWSVSDANYRYFMVQMVAIKGTSIGSTNLEKIEVVYDKPIYASYVTTFCDKLPASTSVTATPTRDGAEVNWSAVDGATGYEVTCSAGTVTYTTGTSATITNLPDNEGGNVEYTVTVRATDNTGAHCQRGAAATQTFNTLRVYTLSYNKNGEDVTGDVPTVSKHVSGVEGLTATNNGNLKREHYTFIGWTDGLTHYDENGAIVLTDDKVLYPDWEAIAVTGISFKKELYQVAKGEIIDLSEELIITPADALYAFDEIVWAISSDYGTAEAGLVEATEAVNRTPVTATLGSVVGTTNLEIIEAQQLATPANIFVNDLTKNSFTLTWEAVEHATGYDVMIGSDHYYPTTNEQTVEGLNACMQYTYKVKAVGDDVYYTASEFSTAAQTTTLAQYKLRFNLNHAVLNADAEDATVTELETLVCSGEEQTAFFTTTTETYSLTNDIVVKLGDEVLDATNYDWDPATGMFYIVMPEMTAHVNVTITAHELAVPEFIFDGETAILYSEVQYITYPYATGINLASYVTKSDDAGDVTFSLPEDESYAWITDGVFNAYAAGDYTVTATLAENNKYFGDSKQLTLHVGYGIEITTNGATVHAEGDGVYKKADGVTYVLVPENFVTMVVDAQPTGMPISCFKGREKTGGTELEFAGNTFIMPESDIQLTAIKWHDSDINTDKEADAQYKGNVTVNNNVTLTVATNSQVPGDLTIDNGGKLTMDGSHIMTVYGDLIINSTQGVSAQIEKPTKVTVAGDVYFAYTLAVSGTTAANQWHNFSVPFPVSATAGVYKRVGDNYVKLTNEVDYAIEDYHGDIRANGQYGWKKFRGTMQPGVTYSMTVNGDIDKFYFKMLGEWNPNNVEAAYSVYEGTGATTDRSWNGLGNTQLNYVSAMSDEFEAIQYLDATSYTYKSVASDEMVFTVGAAFFVQPSAAGSVVFVDNTSGSVVYAPARVVKAQSDRVKLTLSNASSTDNLYLSYSEDALNEYEIGHDLQKMFATSTPKAPMLWTSNYGDIKLASEYAPMVNDDASYALTLYAPAAGEYTLAMPTELTDGTQVYLTQNGSIIWNLTMSEYDVMLNKGNNTEYGILIHKAPQTPTDVENIYGADGEQIEKMIINDHLIIRKGATMYDATGRLVK